MLSNAIGGLFGGGGGGGGAAPQFNMGDFMQQHGGTQLDQFTPEMMNQLTTGLQGGQQGGMNGIFGNLGPLLQGMGAIGGFFNDRSQMDMTKDLMNQQMQMMQEEIARNKQSYNTQLEDRQRGRLSVVDSQGNPKTSTWHLPVDEYMAQHGMK